MPTAYAPGRRWVDTVDPTQTTTEYGNVRVTIGDVWYNSTSGAIWLATDDSGTWVQINTGGGGGGGTTWLSGSGVPSGATGSNGDFYVDTDTGAQYLKDSGSWGIVSPSNALAFIETNSGTSVADVDIDLPSGYDGFRVQFQFLPDTTNTNLRLQVTTDGFSTIEAGATDYEYATDYNWRTGTASNAALTDHILFAFGCGTTAGTHTVIGYFDVFYNEETDVPTTVIGACTHIKATSPLVIHNWRPGGRWKQNTAVDGVRLDFHTGNVADYEYTLYGYRRSAA